MRDSVKNELLKEMTRERTVYGDSYDDIYRNSRRRGGYRGERSTRIEGFESDRRSGISVRYESDRRNSSSLDSDRDRSGIYRSERRSRNSGIERVRRNIGRGERERSIRNRSRISEDIRGYLSRGKSPNERRYETDPPEYETGQIKSGIYGIILFIVLTIAIPYLITTIMSGNSYRASQKMKNIHSGKEIIVKQDGKNIIIDAEQYVAAVLAAEVDMNSADEVLRAKAVMIRTEVYYILGEREIAEATEFQHSYCIGDDLKKLWGKKEYQTNVTRIEEAVLATYGQTE